MSLPDQKEASGQDSRCHRGTWSAGNGACSPRHRVARVRVDAVAWIIATLLLLPPGVATQTPSLHPDPRYLDSPIRPTFTIALSARAVAAPFLLAPNARAAFGGGGDEETDLLGHIQGAALLSSGEVVVLDDKMTRLRVFSATGLPEQSLGRAGRGPGEFSDPLSLAVDSRGALHVGDLRHSIQVFSHSTSGYRLERTLQVDVAVRGLCLLDSVMVIHGMQLRSASILHVYDRLGTRLRSFGVLYQSPNALVNHEFGAGRIACDSATGFVFYVPGGAIGEVRAYRLDGSLVWRTVLSGYRVNRIEDYRGGIRIATNQAGVNFVRALTLLPGRGLLVQIAYRSAQALREGVDYTSLTSVLLDHVTGRPSALGTSLPPIVAATRGEVVLGYDDPAPRFEVRAIRAR